MSTLEEKILDGPRVNYCEAEDDDIRADEELDCFDHEEGRDIETRDAASLFRRPCEEDDRLELLSQVAWRNPSSSNTGPKGVIEDYRNKIQGAGKTPNKHDDIELEFQKLLDDEDFIKEYVSKRISEALRPSLKTFGLVYHLDVGDELLDAIEKESPNVMVIVHIYTRHSKPCAELNRCLKNVAHDYKHIKFCTLDASVTGLSANFKENGVPAILAYKGGELVKSLVQLDEFLDRHFDAEQVKELLADNGLI